MFVYSEGMMKMLNKFSCVVISFAQARAFKKEQIRKREWDREWAREREKERERKRERKGEKERERDTHIS